jgi:predicted nucleic acid-binding protein
MIVVCDTGPLRYLIEVEAVHVLPKLYGRILTTPQVLQELRFEHFPDMVQQWAERPPDWLGVEAPASLAFLDRLDLGEASALSLARERDADLVLVDERAGAEVANSVGLRAVGTLAVLQDAGHESLIDFRTAIHRLTTQTRFRHSEELVRRVIADYERASRERL